jgi:hypothetical protein
VVPGFKDALLSFLNQLFDLNLYLDAPPWAGGILLFLGLSLLLLGFMGQDRLAIGRSRRAPGTALVIKQTGFAPTVPNLRQHELPDDWKHRELQHLAIELSPELSAAPPQLEAALAKQLQMPNQIGAIFGVSPATDLAYCGIVQAPFQFLAGFQLSTWVTARSFEWHRIEHRWVALGAGAGPDLAPQVTQESVGAGPDLAVAIEVSYPVATAEMTASVPTIGDLIRISIAQPAIDKVTHVGQVAAIATLFRAQLDQAKATLPAGATIHVFCAAPMSIGFAAGRMLSRSVHPPVSVYTYSSGAVPPYPWGIEINAAGATSQVVRN